MIGTEKLQELLTAIDSLSRERGYPPTIREIGIAVGISSPATVHKAVNILKRRGWAVSDTKVSRSLRLTDVGREWITQ